MPTGNYTIFLIPFTFPFSQQKVNAFCCYITPTNTSPLFLLTQVSSLQQSFQVASTSSVSLSPGRSTHTHACYFFHLKNLLSRISTDFFFLPFLLHFVKFLKKVFYTVCLQFLLPFTLPNFSQLLLPFSTQTALANVSQRSPLNLMVNSPHLVTLHQLLIQLNSAWFILLPWLPRHYPLLVSSYVPVNTFHFHCRLFFF